MYFSKKILSQTITQLCLAKEIDHIVISPGSRNAPLTIGFTHHPSFKNFSIVDERCAAFFALGLAQQLKKPVALICTSGSAVLNYYPAIAEAFYSDIPLVVISADRPSKFIDVGDGQTIRQENVFKNHILYSANCKEGKENQLFNEIQINSALNAAIELRGPVHINVPFSEPLYEIVEDVEVRPQHVPARIFSANFSEDLSEYIKAWNASSKKIVLVGVLPPNSIEEHYIKWLGKDESVLVLTETTSNLIDSSFFPSIDQLIAPLNPDQFESLRPDILLTFGGMVVSKKVKAFLRDYAPNQHWHIDSKKAFDTYFALNKHFKTSPNIFLKHFSPKTISVSSGYKQEWSDLKKYRLERHNEYEKLCSYSDFKVFSEIFKRLPEHRQLHLSNSAAIRYAQLFTLPASLEVFCNRGTSGIDGSMSTAIGAAIISKLPTVYITGDLSFFYDSNALWNTYIPSNFKIIVINNGGGGIFRILPGAKNVDHFETYFETEHELSAESLCTMFGINYSKATDLNELNQELEVFFNDSNSARLLEIVTPSKMNDQVLNDYFMFIA